MSSEFCKEMVGCHKLRVQSSPYALPPGSQLPIKVLITIHHTSLGNAPKFDALHNSIFTVQTGWKSMYCTSVPKAYSQYYLSTIQHDLCLAAVVIILGHLRYFLVRTKVWRKKHSWLCKSRRVLYSTMKRYISQVLVLLLWKGKMWLPGDKTAV